MIQKTKIEWCDYTANPIRYRRADDPTGQRGSVWACVKASEGCQNCYAESRAWRFQGRQFTASAMRGVVPYVDEGELRSMLSRRRLPAGSRCFVGDMTDVFGEWVPFELLDRVFAVMALRPDVVFQVLTKRPERMREYLTSADRMYVLRSSIEEWLTEDDCRLRWPLPNVWLGTSVEDQRWADVRIPELLATPAAVHWVSYEPALGPVHFRTYFHESTCALQADWTDICTCSDPYEYRVRWVVCGGESGPGARPCDVAWVRSLREQCRAAGVAVFVKQLGAKPVGLPAVRMHRKGDQAWRAIETWPEDLRVREMPAQFRVPMGRFPRMTLKDWEVAAKAHDPEATHTNLRLRDRKGADPAEWPEDLKVREMPR